MSFKRKGHVMNTRCCLERSWRWLCL